MKKNVIKKVEGTSRIEAFSDSIFAFSMTLLVMDIKIPPLTGATNSEIALLLWEQLPKFIIFILSFVVIAILWINHHHFFQNFKHTDWKLLWYNNFLLFWVVLMPFSTDFIGEHPFVSLVVAIYSGIMFMVALSFLLMVKYVFFKSHLLDINIGMQERKEEFRHTLPAVFLYGAATLLSFWRIEIPLVILFLVPTIYFVPSVLHKAQMD